MYAWKSRCRPAGVLTGSETSSKGPRAASKRLASSSASPSSETASPVRIASCSAAPSPNLEPISAGSSAYRIVPSGSRMVTRAMGPRRRLPLTTSSIVRRLEESPLVIPSVSRGSTTPRPATIAMRSACRNASAVPSRRMTSTPATPTRTSTTKPVIANASTARATDVLRSCTASIMASEARSPHARTRRIGVRAKIPHPSSGPRRSGHGEGKRHAGRSVGPADPERPVGVRDAPRSRRRPAGARLPGRARPSCATTSGRSRTCTTMLKAHGDWMPLGNADEQKPAKEGTVEAWARSPDNPVGGWYGLKKGLRGRFGNYVPRSWRCSAWPRSSTSPATIGCARSSPLRTFLKGGGPGTAEGRSRAAEGTSALRGRLDDRGRAVRPVVREQGQDRRVVAGRRGADARRRSVWRRHSRRRPRTPCRRAGRSRGPGPRRRTRGLHVPAVVVEHTRRVADLPRHVAGEGPGARRHL